MKVKVTAEVWSAVISAASDGSAPAYLYDHTTVTDTWETTKRTYRVLCTTVVRWVDPSRTGSHTEAVAEAVRHATYQCERLQSGLHFAVVAGDRDEAINVLDQQGLFDAHVNEEVR